MSERFAEYDPTVCLNCGQELPEQNPYCPTCGQQNRRHERSLGAWIVEGLSSLFHLEGKSWNTVRDIWVPGKYVERYLSGQRQRYVHPLRLLLLSSLVCFAVVKLMVVPGEESTQDLIENNEGLEEDIAEAESDLAKSRAEIAELEDELRRLESLASSIETEASKIAVRAELSGLRGAIPAQESGITAMQRELRRETIVLDDTTQIARGRMRQIDRKRMNVVVRGTLSAYERSVDNADDTAPDTALLNYLRAEFPTGGVWSEFTDDDTGELSVLGERANISARMLATGTPSTIVDAAGVAGTIPRILLRKVISVYQSGVASLNEYLFGQLTWAVLLFVPFFGLTYKLLYWRRLDYYTQHLTYAAVLIAVLLLFLTAGIIAGQVFRAQHVILCLSLAFVIYAIAGEARLYRTAYYKAALKFVFGVGTVGSFFFLMAMFIWLFIAFLLN